MTLGLYNDANTYIFFDTDATKICLPSYYIPIYSYFSAPQVTVKRKNASNSPKGVPRTYHTAQRIPACSEHSDGRTADPDFSAAEG